MQGLLMQLWSDDDGFIVSTELVLISTITVIGMIVGLTTVRDVVVIELADVADAISEIDQSYSYGQIVGHCGSTAGVRFHDRADFCENRRAEDDQNPRGGAQCITLCADGTSDENT
ncbi:MAG: hypothetical protein SFV23_20515 [Planctomycetaceae bacterium]|nr:hypothetical protein [Planctomycetaceae bacterium]